jgi:pyrroloquinoline quinone biosynthesis protein D
MMQEFSGPSRHWSRQLCFPPLVRHPGVAWQELDGEAVLHDPHTGATHHLNGTALEVWRACDGRSDAAAIAERLAEHYAVSLAQAQADVEELLVMLAEADLVTEATP